VVDHPADAVAVEDDAQQLTIYHELLSNPGALPGPGSRRLRQACPDQAQEQTLPRYPRLRRRDRAAQFTEAFDAVLSGPAEPRLRLPPA
jgi:hypothetical protein